MSKQRLRLEIITPNYKFPEGDKEGAIIEVDKVIVPSAMGEMCILPDHAPLLAMLVPGIIRFKTSYGPEEFACLPGVVQVKDNCVSILVGEIWGSEDLPQDLEPPPKYPNDPKKEREAELLYRAKLKLRAGN